MRIKYKSKIIILSSLFHCIIYHPVHICNIILFPSVHNIQTIYSQVWVWSVTCLRALHSYIAHCQYLLTGGSYYRLSVYQCYETLTLLVFVSYRVPLVKPSPLQDRALHKVGNTQTKIKPAQELGMYIFHTFHKSHSTVWQSNVHICRKTSTLCSHFHQIQRMLKNNLVIVIKTPYTQATNVCSTLNSHVMNKIKFSNCTYSNKFCCVVLIL